MSSRIIANWWNEDEEGQWAKNVEAAFISQERQKKTVDGEWVKAEIQEAARAIDIGAPPPPKTRTFTQASADPPWVSEYLGQYEPFVAPVGMGKKTAQELAEEKYQAIIRADGRVGYSKVQTIAKEPQEPAVEFEQRPVNW